MNSRSRLAGFERPASRLAAAVILVAVLLSAGCSAPWSGGSNSHRGVLNWFNNTAGGTWVTTLDPALVTDAVSISDIRMIDANLVRVVSRQSGSGRPSLHIVPDLATWTVSADRRVWTFRIRPNARFANGDRVTASDAAWSITRALLPATRSTVALTYLSHITGAEDVAAGRSRTLVGLSVIDRRTLRITLDSPIAYFLPALSYPTADVLDRRVLVTHPAGSYLTDTCAANVGAGPFRPVCRNRGSGRTSFYAPGGTPAIDLRPNRYYYGKRPHIRIHSPFVADPHVAWSWYGDGKLDGVSVPVSQVGTARTEPGFLRVPLLQTDFLTPNSQLPPFNDLNCRLAVAYAINRARITGTVLAGTEGPLYDVLPPGLRGYFGRESDVPAYDPARARAYLARCPGKLQGVTITYDGTTGEVRREYRAIRHDLAAIGARVTLRPLSFHRWLDIIGHGMTSSQEQVQLTQNLWIDDYPDPQDWCDTLLHSGGNFDIGGFHNARYDQLVDQANVELDPARRGLLYQEAQKVALDDGAWISVGYAYGQYVVNPRVHGMVASPQGGVWPRNGDWWKVSIS